MCLGRKFGWSVILSLVTWAALCQSSGGKEAQGSAAGETAERLASLLTMDVTEARMFPGDDARAASADLDDSGWKIIHRDEEWTQNSVWLRAHIVVPERIRGYDLRGGRLTLSLSLRGTKSVRLFLDGVALNLRQEGARAAGAKTGRLTSFLDSDASLGTLSASIGVNPDLGHRHTPGGT
jgi:hypothetical protein